jgi:hypothetical protein
VEQWSQGLAEHWTLARVRAGVAAAAAALGPSRLVLRCGAECEPLKVRVAVK